MSVPAVNEKIITTRVYTFSETQMVKIQVVGQQSETIVARATKAEEVFEQAASQTSAVNILVLKNEKDEVVGKFTVSKIAGWWLS